MPELKARWSHSPGSCETTTTQRKTASSSSRRPSEPSPGLPGPWSSGLGTRTSRRMMSLRVTRSGLRACAKDIESGASSHGGASMVLTEPPSCSVCSDSHGMSSLGSEDDGDVEDEEELPPGAPRSAEIPELLVRSSKQPVLPGYFERGADSMPAARSCLPARTESSAACTLAASHTYSSSSACKRASLSCISARSSLAL
mmetsp:Transcript_21539/g.62394  ORF Transcript_21539/g.62394 Transcript_21539/m.62394 type:complete len:200 (-) Transcript_21539:1751-2350(-)